MSRSSPPPKNPSRPAGPDQIPREFAWVFPDQDVRRLAAERDIVYLLGRILEFGGADEVRWALGRYGPERIHAFLRETGHPELSPRTLSFWRAFFNAEEETWASGPDWRKGNAAPWV